MKTEDARVLIDAFKEKNIEAYRLALAASLAVRLEPELLRALRFGLVKEADAGAEADLWFSLLFQSQTPLALEFEPGALELLRRDLAAEPELLRGAWRVISEFHAAAPYALRLEEELTWLGLSGGDNRARIEERLRSALDRLRAGRIGIAHWAQRALPSLPEKARTTQAAVWLSLAAGLRVGEEPALKEVPARGVSEEWLSGFSASRISRVRIGVRWLKNEAASPPPGGSTSATTTPELPMFVELSHPPAPSSQLIEVPDIYRLLLEVSWGEAGGRRQRQLSLLREETRRVPVGYDDVTIRTELGDLFTLGPHFEYDFLILHYQATERLARTIVRRLREQDWNGKRLNAVASPFDPSYEPGGDLEELKRRFGLSRKVGLLISDNHTYPNLTAHLEPLRPEPLGRHDWQILMVHAGIQAPASRGHTIDFRPSLMDFEDSFRELWRAITGEELPLPRPRPEDGESLELFISYSHRDDKLRQQLGVHLAQLKRGQIVAEWHDRCITPGQKWDGEIDEHLNSAQVILLLVSPDFLASDYCYGIEVRRAIERHEAGEAVVIPVILRPCDWEKAPFGRLQALPAEGRAISLWRPRDAAFLDVVQGIHRAAEQLLAHRQATAGRLAASSSPTNIPRSPVVGFVARRDQGGRDILTRLLEELPQGRLVALWGPGGSGKTTLAAEAARALRTRFPGRLAWVSAFGRTEFSLSSLLDDIITQLAPGVARPPTPEAKEAFVRSLAAESPMLVVLDNLETVTPPEEQSRCLDFLSSCPDCPALITTRLRINRDDVTYVRLAAMEHDEAREFLRRLIDNSGRPSAFDGQDRDELITACEANPLVLQWAAGQIVEGRRAADVLEDIRRGKGDAAQRFFTRSFELPYLGDDGRAALLALSLFAPDASREALAHVAGFGEDLPRLEAAVAKLSSLWLADATPGNERLLLRGLTRELARTRLDAEPNAPDYRRRFIAYFLGYAIAHKNVSAEDFDALEAERENLLSTFDDAFTLEDWRSMMMIRSALEEYLSLRGYWDEAISTGEQALHAARLQQDESAVARFAHNLAVIYLRRGEVEEARRLYGESLEINKKLGNQSGIAITLHDLGRLTQNTGEMEEARRLYDESLEIAKRLGDQSGIASTLRGLGSLARDVGELDEAQRLLNESLAIYSRLNSQKSIADTLHELGLVINQLGDHTEAVRLVSESLRVLERIGSPDAEIARQSLARLEGEVY
ncbi:MAG TPA: toll/interleukin-1 receptor domain-containing protein [Pyrinomonadaceae bacterium]|nr:toll/interleukin-1 receptor domain-containing protein [Pyrinomonadaceae bacterium]